MKRNMKKNNKSKVLYIQTTDLKDSIQRLIDSSGDVSVFFKTDLFSLLDSLSETVEKGSERCPFCNASLKQYWHKLTPILVNALVKFKRGVLKEGENRVHLIKTLKGTENELKPYEWKNWTKLRFHGLVAKYKVDGVWDRGYWVLTKRGNDFLQGKLAVPSKVQTFRNKVIDHGDNLVYIKDVLGSTPYLEDSDFEYSLFND